MQEQYLEILVQSMKKKLDVLYEIQAMNEEQRILLMDDNLPPEDFEKNIQKKSELIDQLDILDNGFDEVYQRVRVQLRENQSLYREQIGLLQSLIRDVTA